MRNLIVDLMSAHPELTIEHMNGVLKAIVFKELPNAAPQKTTKASVIALGWSVLILKNASFSSIFKAEIHKLFDYQLALYQMILSSGNLRILEMAEKVLFDLWNGNTNLFNDCFKYFIGKDAGTSVIVFLMLLLKFKQLYDIETDFLDQERSKVLDHFIKDIVTTKTKPNINITLSCRPLLASVTKEEFENLIYSALQRSMLRSPEIIMQGVGVIVQDISLECDEYANNLGKVLIQNLYSKDDITRQESVNSLKQLSMKCSKAESIEDLLQKIFAILRGSDGKITVAEYRMNLLQVKSLCITLT